MPLVLPESHPRRVGGAPSTDLMIERDRARELRIGILNIMPRLEAYEPLLLGPLARIRRPIEPVFLRLETHGYGSSDHAYLDRFYQTLDQALAGGPLDGLILTGAPVEELPFEEVRYWPELLRLFEFARTNVPSTLGICWGGMALGGAIGIPKVLFPKKLFGVFGDRRLEAKHPLLFGQDDVFRCAHSRHSGVRDADLEAAAKDGRVRLLSHGAETGYTLFETPDHRFVMHLGHPEYVAERLSFEWERDRALGRTDVPPPNDFDTERPTTTWFDHRERLFASWISLVTEHVDAAPRAVSDAASNGGQRRAISL